MKLKRKYQLLLFSAIVSVPLLLLFISILIAAIYDFAFKTNNNGVPFHESFAYPTMLAVFLISLVLLALFFSKSINSLLNKINMLNHTIRNLASDEKTPNKLDVQREDELGELIKSVNLLIERTTYRELELKQQEEMQKEIFHKLRHDINTPLTALKLQLFYLEDNSNNHTFILESLDQQVQYIADLTSEFNLQPTASLENSYILTNEVNMNDLLEMMVKKWGYLYSVQNVELIYACSQKDMVWTSNALWLQRLFDNIFQNTLKHSKAKRMEITIDSGVVKFRDNGIGFDTNRKHAGLGLKIIEDTARILNLECTMHSDKNGTLFYIIDL
ncbi:HAMP domain-containing sensor histidine kinase [Psychrobacillus sp.]|uniref:sensor histidine kinase n=1 Tax=Psychrobacillus sp. TaxID=1871623 RepID=UPI0028BEA254|nr:HAMP domain-containing sensor histidine kinase [Psychrobacillus sp.]